MSNIIDPEAKEIEALRRLSGWKRARVLEIGCGDGRLTLRLAQLGAKVVAIEPDRSLVRKARRRLPNRFADQIKYCVGTTAKLKHPPESFDRVIFAWSL
jgi:protein-L-isoaspartate O-methyltransferase